MCAEPLPGTATWVNDVHSRLNRTRVREVAPVERPEDVVRAVLRARRLGQSLSPAGGRHAMGGQQFATDTLLLDMRGLTGVSDLDRDRGTVEVLAGTEWPELMASLVEMQEGCRHSGCFPSCVGS